MGEPVGNIVVICGLQSDGTIRAIELTDADAIKAAFASAAQGLVGNHGYIAGDWQKSPFPLGYSGRKTIAAAAQSDGSSPTIATTAVVPAGELWLLQSVIMWHTDATSRQCVLYGYDAIGEIIRELDTQLTLPVQTTLSAAHPIILAEDEYITAYGYSVADTKYVHVRCWGYRIDIDQ